MVHIFQQFHKMIQTQYSKKIRILRSDNGGEFVNHQFHEYFKKHGLIHETTCPQTPQQNGIAERKNCHILETARALLHGAHVPHHHWTDAVTTAVYLINRMPSKVLEFKTPLQTLSTFVPLPTIQMLPPRVFGCVAFVTYIKTSVQSLIRVPFVACFWDMVHTRKGIAAMTLLLDACM